MSRMDPTLVFSMTMRCNLFFLSCLALAGDVRAESEAFDQIYGSVPEYRLIAKSFMPAAARPVTNHDYAVQPSSPAVINDATQFPILVPALRGAARPHTTDYETNTQPIRPQAESQQDTVEDSDSGMFTYAFRIFAGFFSVSAGLAALLAVLRKFCFPAAGATTRTQNGAKRNPVHAGVSDEQHQQIHRVSAVAMNSARGSNAVAMVTAEQTGGDFETLGLSPCLVQALRKSGIVEPTEVQRTAFDAILSGNDAVILSETGTGKTLAYALPLLEQLRSQSQDAGGSQVDTSSPRPLDKVLVLVPNRDLCAQVTEVFAGLIAELPEDEQRAIQVSSLVSYSANPDATILVSTPPVAIEALPGPRSIRWVVLDEADALLAGSFKLTARQKYPIEKLIAGIKRSAKEEAMASGNVTGARDRRKRGDRRKRAEQFYSTKQFLVVGATMPNAGTRNAEEHVKYLFPTANWYRAARLHQSKAELKHYFVQVDEATRATALQQAVRHGPAGKILVFANTVPMAENATSVIAGELGEEMVAAFHKNLPPVERSELLSAHARGDLRVLVCTGLAARGIDFVDVQHVVQYEVATNAVEFMHRVGRTARAGKTGTTTTLYTNDRADLVEGLRNAISTGQSIDHLFSRKRSFMLGLKKKRLREQSEVYETAEEMAAFNDDGAFSDDSGAGLSDSLHGSNLEASHNDNVAFDETVKETELTSSEDLQIDKATEPTRSAEVQIDLQSLTVAQLKEKLRSRGLKVSGTKAELICRLQEAT